MIAQLPSRSKRLETELAQRKLRSEQAFKAKQKAIRDELNRRKSEKAAMHPVIERNWENAGKLMQFQAIQTRVEDALHYIRPAQHRYSAIPVRFQALRTNPVYKPFVIMDNQNQALWSTNDLALVASHLANYESHYMLDFRPVNHFQRNNILAALAHPVGRSTYGESAVIPPPPKPKKQNLGPKPQNFDKLLYDVTLEVQRMNLPPEIEPIILAEAKFIAPIYGWEAVTDLLHEVSLLQYTEAAEAIQTFHEDKDGNTWVETKWEPVASFDNYQQAADWVKDMNEFGDKLLDQHGKELDLPRFKTIKP